MISIGNEARPVRRISHGNSVTWTIPSSSGGVVELACGLSPEEATPTLSAEFRVYRVDGSRRTQIGARTVRPSQPATWVTWTVPWKRHFSPMELSIDIDCLSDGKPLPDPLSAPALLAEPILVPESGHAAVRENMVVFLIDTLRADRLGCYGDRSASTPEIDRLAAEGLRVDRVLSAANWTLPAHASLFTSASVARHQAGGLRRTLGRELPTLAETLQARGYRTLAVTNGGFVNPNFGVARGFDRYLCVDLHSENVRASVKRALELIAPYRGEPVFLFFHTYQVHQYPHELGVHPDKVADSNLLSRLMNRKYDEEVTLADAAFGDLRRGLPALGIASRTALVLTSDHGEMLNDRPGSIPTRVYGHSHPYLHDEENRIPLVLFDPRNPARGRVLAGPASLLDIAPTVLDVLDLAPNPSFEGVPLSNLEKNPALSSSRTLITEEPYNECLAAERGGRKLILRPARSFRSLWWGKFYATIAPLESYDLLKDPGEKRDLGAKMPGSGALRAAADRDIAEHFPGSVLVRVPAHAPVVMLSFRAKSGIRRAMLFGSRDGDLDPALDASGAAHVEVPSGGSDLWIAVAPNRPRDLLELGIESATPLTASLGDGEALTEGERRARWEALLPRRDLPEIAGALLLYAAALDPAKESASTESGPTPENIEQLRSLGYLNLPGKESGASSGAEAARGFSGPGPGILIVTIGSEKTAGARPGAAK
jgi:arylsulfatase A-like enzyme